MPEKRRNLFEETLKYYRKEEPYLKEMSRKRLEEDSQHFKGYESLYNRIKSGDGVPCDVCRIPVIADIYGEVVENTAKKELKVTCRRCSIPNSGFGG
jgi:hypothetical protein